MRTISIWLILVLVSVGLSQSLFGQNSSIARIEAKIAEVRAMTEEESNTIDLLQQQLAKAHKRNDQNHVARIKDEIDSAWKRKNRLNDVQQHLGLLLNGIQAPAADKSPPAGNHPPGPRPWNDRPRRQIARIQSDDHDGNIAKRIPAQQVKQENPGPGKNARGAAAFPPAAPPSQKSSRLERLRASFQHLNEIGEFDLSRRVSELINREEARLKELERQRPENEQKRFGQKSLQRQRAGGSPSLDGKRLTADGDFAEMAPPPANADDAIVVNQLRQLVADMRNEIQQLRNEVKRLRDR